MPVHHTGVILAAGRGSRINPLSTVMPKPLLPVCNRPIIQHQMEAMREVGITNLVIVVSEAGGAIEQHFGDGAQLDMRIEYVIDEHPCGIASSLALTEPFVGNAFAVFLGDIFLDMASLHPALAAIERPDVSGVVLVKHERDPNAIRRNFAVICDDQGWISRVVEKPKELYNDLKGCGVYLFDETIFGAIRRTPRSPLRNEYELTDAIQTLIDMGRGVRSADLVRWDINVTYPIDLLNANLMWLRQQGLPYLIGRRVRLAQGTQLCDVIIGDEVEISHPVKISESVLFPRARLDAGVRSLNRCLLLPEMSLSLA